MSDLAKRRTLCATISQPIETVSPGIQKLDVIFFYGRKCLKGSPRAGKYDAYGSTNRVTVRFQSDSHFPEYAPEVRFDLESVDARRLIQTISRVVEKIRARYEEITRAGLVAETGALVVEYDNEPWTYSVVTHEPASA